MSSIVKWLFLLAILCFVHLDCEIYQDRSKIKTSNGDLILEPAFDKSIYLRPNGPKSRVFVGELDILKRKANTNEEIQFQPSGEDLDKLINGPSGILQRLGILESKTTAVPNDLLFNVSTLWRKVNTLSRKVQTLQNLMKIRKTDFCLSQPCQHGGTCLNLASGYYCMCPLNWEGKDCDMDVNECRNFAGTDLGCQNGATCINLPGSYECLCRSDWYGLHCTRKEKDCSGGDFEMCGYGTCVQVSSGKGITCLCHQGWTTNSTGVACLTDINECESSQGSKCSTNPKVDCINIPGSFRCGRCPSGYEGDGYWCSDINECTTIPNGGCSPMVTCHNTIGSRICGLCPVGYQGDGVTCTWRGSCNINHGGCHPSARCIEGVVPGGQAAQCVCPDGMDGDGVGIGGCYVTTGGNFTQRCESNPCGTRGQCRPLRTGYTCICYKGYGGAHCDEPIDYCANSPCQNGGTCRADSLSSRGFRCECTGQYTGSLCQVKAKTCGGVIDAEEGSIIYPINNTIYSHDSQCAWVVRTIATKVINVTFSRFNIEEQGGCQFDFLQIHDGGKSSDQLIGRFCGNTYPNGGNIVSSHNKLYLWFHSDKTVAREGFALHWTSIDPVCGGEVDATTHGHISSPGSPGSYPPNRDCYWHLTTSLEKIINLHFYALDIEKHMNCSFDYLAIYDGEHDTDPLLSKYCNSTQPAPIQSGGPHMLIHFHSDAYGAGKGFQIVYAPTEGVPGCGGYYTTDKGEISSPSYDGKYTSNLLCEYKLRTSPETKIKISFKLFHLEQSVRCKYDYLKIYDGPSADSRLVGKFCGNAFPQSYVSSSNTLYFKFKTDRSISLEGFRINYQAICEKLITGDSGVIKSPGYPFNYPQNKICEYIIKTSPGKAIQLTFQYFDIEDNMQYNCRYDYVEIRDGLDVNSTLLGKYCGGSEHIPPVATSTHNYMYIKFASDLSISGTGFYANYTTIDTSCGGIHKETMGLINHPSQDSMNYENSQECSWVIIAPEGMRIKLSWNRFEMEERPNCISDYLELTEIDNNNNNIVMGKYCGQKKPPAITTDTNRLKLKFVSDESVRMLGFSVSYTVLDERTHCGGNYIRTHGYLNSPGWPKPYEPNRDCKWVLTVPAGQQIMLNISYFSLEEAIRGKCDSGDFLEIRNGNSMNAPLIGKYCGSFGSRRITSLANVLYLHFHSDYALGGGGFRIEWDGTISGCGGTLTSSSGSISSPNYPNNYDDNTECFYRIVTNAGSRIHISFTELDLERTSNCRDDYIQIYNGRDATAPSMGKYCAMPINLPHIETSTNFAYILFRSDFYGRGKGFMLNYNTVCNSNITGRYGAIESPDYPNYYPLNLNCLWTIKVPRGNKINITFSHFDVYRGRSYLRRNNHDRFYPYRRFNVYHPWNRYLDFYEESSLDYDVYYHDCQSYLQTKEPTDINFSDRICGNSLPSPIHTKSNLIQIKFYSGYFIARTGFRLEWNIDGCGGHIQKQMGTLSLDKSLTSGEVLECEWLIETQIGTSISITFTSIHMTDSKDCTTDSIEMYNGQNVMSPCLAKICQNVSTPSTFQTDSNFMFVRFQKQSALRDIHFGSQFRSFEAKCGGYINSKSGLIHSKNYPKNYDNNIDCIWYITAPINHRIEINFLELDLYSAVSNYDEEQCRDAVYIYNGVQIRDSNYTYRICPNSNITQFITQTNSVVLQFKTDHNMTAKGFKANFSAICGGIINASSDGIIKNNQAVSHTNISCIWTILAPTLDQKISLTITHISLKNNNDIVTIKSCRGSFLRIFDGNDSNSPLIEEYCGRTIPPMIVSRGSALTLQLGTYSEKIEGVFEAHYSPLINACGGKLIAEKGVIASPNYPRPYPNGLDCEWIISTSPGNTAFVSIRDIDLEDSDRCNEDFLEIRENNGAGRLLGVYCGNQVTSTNNTVASKLYINFHTNSKTSANKGFIIYYEYVHENLIQGDNGEITSPLYPVQYHGAGDFTWRISTSDSDTISISVDHLLIPSLKDASYNKLSIYDGYDETAPLLKELYGVLIEEVKTMQTTSNVALIKLKMDESNSGSLFHMRWTNAVTTESEENQINCGSNQTELVLPGHSSVLKSPNYPQNYRNNLNCAWIYKAEPGRHLAIHFADFELEETHFCTGDSVSIYSSENALIWKPVKENVCLPSSVADEQNSTTYMKVKFKSDYNFNYRGFAAHVFSKCGGSISDLSGEITVTLLDLSHGQDNVYLFPIRQLIIKCEWAIKVRPGRTIKLEFSHFNITNNEQECTTHVTLRNGDSNEAPLLGNGRYCGYENEVRDPITTSSNALFLSYTTNTRASFQNFIIRYEEKNEECGLTSKLSSDHTWEVISSPNYPNVANPYTECEWIFTGPPGEILRIDFIDKMDMKKDENCAAEFVEIRDGSSTISPLLGGRRYCTEAPTATLKTTNNAVYIKYLTQLSDPNDGFKLNVSIDICGGTIKASAGELISPGYPHMLALKPNIICKWSIIVPPRYVSQIKVQDLDLPDPESHCGNNLVIQETIPVTNTLVVHNRLCAGSDDENSSYSVQSLTNEVSIVLYIGATNSWVQSSQYRGFKITFNSSRPSCGGDLTISEGYLISPSYPRETTVKYCRWSITVPNKRRRVRLEILDFDSEKHRIELINNNLFMYSIQEILNSTGSSSTHVYESSGNTLSFYVTLTPSVSSHRFKAHFSSNDEALCGGELSGSTGQLISPNLQQTYICEWHLNSQEQDRDTTLNYNTVYITGNVNSTMTGTRCSYFGTKLVIQAEVTVLDTRVRFMRKLCNSDFSYRVPITALDFKAMKTKDDSLNYHLTWKIQPCGETIIAGENPVDILNLPSSYNDTLDCAWIIIAPGNNQIVLNMEGSFNLECDDQFVKIIRGFTFQSPTIRNICKDNVLTSPLTVRFKYIYVEYHSKSNNNRNLKLNVKTATHQCGGHLGHYQRAFASPNYPKRYSPNQECAWEIETRMGYRVSLRFVDRFVIEDKPNCTNDVVIIYDWKNGDYTEVAKICGREVPPPYNSTFNRMKIVFRTDALINLNGFKAQWVPICGGKYIATEKEQILFSPGYPGYPSLTTCNYEISASNKKVLLKFLDFELEDSYPACKYDNLTLFAQSDYNYLLLPQYCGKETPPIISNYEKITLSFRTDKYIQKRGFKISYSIFTCGGRINESSVLTSHFGDSYDDNMNCTWFIEAPVSKVVTLKFLYIDLEGNDDCDYDYVAVYEGQVLDEDKRLALLCGYVNSTTYIRSQSSKMVLNFISDIGLTYKGFKVEVIFSYSEAAGCGGLINLTNTSSHILHSPIMGRNHTYENFLNCEWLIVSPPDTMIKIEFTAFHVAPCQSINQTEIGYTKCDCDFVEIKDGINPNSLSIGTYCGHSFPPLVVSSHNSMSVMFSTDGDVTSYGFNATLSTQKSVCGTSEIAISNTSKRFTSPVDSEGNILRGLHCIYSINADLYSYSLIRLTITKFDLLPPETDGGNTNVCTKDKLIISNNRVTHNMTIGKNYIAHHDNDRFFEDYYYETKTSRLPARLELCGIRETVDYYFTGSVSIHLVTSTETDNKIHKGVEIEAVLVGMCGRNYTDSQGRLQAIYGTNIKNETCYTLITAPENYTISVYFMLVTVNYWDSECYLDMFDGNTTSARRLTRITGEYDEKNSIFTTGRYLLLQNQPHRFISVNYDLNYVTTNKGRGCGGRLTNVFGTVTSPMYPSIYRQSNTCEWKLETPRSSRLKLHFTEFDMGILCDQNYLQLVDSKGTVISTFCSDTPADYTSVDNYVKIVFVTSVNNGGKGWVAQFAALG